MIGTLAAASGSASFSLYYVITTILGATTVAISLYVVSVTRKSSSDRQVSHSTALDLSVAALEKEIAKIDVSGGPAITATTLTTLKESISDIRQNMVRIDVLPGVVVRLALLENQVGVLWAEKLANGHSRSPHRDDVETERMLLEMNSAIKAIQAYIKLQGGNDGC